MVATAAVSIHPTGMHSYTHMLSKTCKTTQNQFYLHSGKVGYMNYYFKMGLLANRGADL